MAKKSRQELRKVRVQILERYKASNGDRKKFSVTKISREFGIGKTAIYRWINEYKQTGNIHPIRRKLGGPSKFSDSQIGHLIRLLRNGAIAHGYKDDRWTDKRLQALMLHEFGTSYYPLYIKKVLEKHGCILKPHKSSRVQRHFNEVLRIIETNKASDLGFADIYWTQKRVTLLTRRLFAVPYSLTAICRYLYAHGWSFLKERRRAQSKTAD